MMKSLTPELHKCIFRIDYKPKISFYDNLHKERELYSFFPEWLTDRLKIVFRDFKKRHSLIVSFNSVAFETDKYKEEEEDQVYKMVLNEIESFANKEDVTRFGRRLQYLLPVDFSFESLVEILNLKIFSNEFLKNIGIEIEDNSFVITSKIEEYYIRLMFGPMKKLEVPTYIKFNIDNHLDPSLPEKDKYSELDKLLTYPNLSLFMDIDIYQTFLGKKNDLQDQIAKTRIIVDRTINNLIPYIFQSKI